MLVKDPYNLSMQQIGDLTDWQIAEVFFRPKAGEGTATTARKPAFDFAEAMAVAAAEVGAPPPEVIGG